MSRSNRPGWDDVPPLSLSLSLSIAPFVRSILRPNDLRGWASRGAETTQSMTMWQDIALGQGEQRPFGKGSERSCHRVYYFPTERRDSNNKCEQIPPAASPAPISARQEDRISGGRHHSVGRPSVCQLFGYRAKTREERGGGEGGGGSSRGGVGVNAKC